MYQNEQLNTDITMYSLVFKFSLPIYFFKYMPDHTMPTVGCRQTVVCICFCICLYICVFLFEKFKLKAPNVLQKSKDYLVKCLWCSILSSRWVASKYSKFVLFVYLKISLVNNSLYVYSNKHFVCYALALHRTKCI